VNQMLYNDRNNIRIDAVWSCNTGKKKQRSV